MTRILILMLCLIPTLLWADAGKLDSFEGDVKITAKNITKSAVAGVEINEGDYVRTGANSWALFEMSDGASITLRPLTEIRISKYRFTEDGPAAQNSSLIDLTKGALRMITGLIGQSNRQGYAVKTATATIGVRGTDHEPAYYPPGDAEVRDQEAGSFDKVNDGETFIRNEGGQEVVVRRGRIAFMSQNRRLAPRLLDGEPQFFRRMAAFDRRVAVRREAMHQRIDERRKQRQEQRKENMELRQEDKKISRELKKEARQEVQADFKAERDERQKNIQEKREQRRADKGAEKGAEQR